LIRRSPYWEQISNPGRPLPTLRQDRHSRRHTHQALHVSFGPRIVETVGYKILETRGIPAPFPGRKGLSSYQIFIRAEAKPTVNNLLCETISGSDALKAEVLGQAD